MRWPKLLIPIIINFNTFSQIQNGTSRQLNAKDWKSFRKHYWNKVKYVKFKTADGSEVSHIKGLMMATIHCS